MSQYDTYIRLCHVVEQTAGITVATPNDFELLSHIIFQRQRVTLSASTLKRLWGYAGQKANPRSFTLDTLAEFAGYKNFAAFEQSTGGDHEQSSLLFLRDTLDADKLPTGCRLKLQWKPNRTCIVQHLGNSQFTIVSAENTKLSVGDRFECHLFINHEPLYIDQLIHNGMAPVSYVAGRIDGIVVRIIE